MFVYEWKMLLHQHGVTDIKFWVNCPVTSTKCNGFVSLSEKNPDFQKKEKHWKKQKLSPFE